MSEKTLTTFAVARSAFIESATAHRELARRYLRHEIGEAEFLDSVERQSAALHALAAERRAELLRGTQL